jgi:hypothetical protein
MGLSWSVLGDVGFGSETSLSSMQKVSYFHVIYDVMAMDSVI